MWQLECYTFLSGLLHPSLCSWKCRFKNRDPHGVLGCNQLSTVVHKNSFLAVDWVAHSGFALKGCGVPSGVTMWQLVWESDSGLIVSGCG